MALGRGPGRNSMCKGSEVGEYLEWPETQWVSSGGSKRQVVEGMIGGNKAPAHTVPVGWSMISGNCLKRELGASAGF